MKKVLFIILAIMITSGCALAWKTPRWSYFPLNVYIQEHPKKAVVERALSTWETKTNSLVRFKLKTSTANAPLIIKFSTTDKDIQKDDFENAVGLASTVDPWGFYTKATITIFLENPSSGQKLSDSQLYEISLHEIGHALGLKHTQSSADIMYPYTHGQTNLSPDDIKNLEEIYKPD